MVDPFKTKSLNRLKRIRGQIDGVIKMIEDEKYCIDILTQVLAINGSLKGLTTQILESHLNTCGHKLADKNSKTRQQFIAEIVKACELSNR